MTGAVPSVTSGAVPSGDLAGRVVVVTGASRGIGRGIALRLGAAGARLVLTARRAERLAEVAAELEARGVEQLSRACDVADREAALDVVAAAVERFGRVDGLVANAQTFRSVRPLEDVPPADLDVLLDTGPKGTLWWMQAVFPHMRAAGWGRIVTMGSAMGITGAPGYGPYAASKEAIRSLTRTAAREWARHGIVVNCVCPASVAHRLPPEGSDPAREAAYRAMYADHPMGRDGDPEADIAPPVEFLLSEGCRYLTGQTFMVDGGGLLRA